MCDGKYVILYITVYSVWSWPGFHLGSPYLRAKESTVTHPDPWADQGLSDLWRSGDQLPDGC